MPKSRFSQQNISLGLGFSMRVEEDHTLLQREGIMMMMMIMILSLEISLDWLLVWKQNLNIEVATVELSHGLGECRGDSIFCWLEAEEMQTGSQCWAQAGFRAQPQAECGYDSTVVTFLCRTVATHWRLSLTEERFIFWHKSKPLFLLFSMTNYLVTSKIKQFCMCFLVHISPQVWLLFYQAQNLLIAHAQPKALRLKQ